MFGGSGGKCIDKIFLLNIMYFRMLFNEAGRTTSYLLADMPSGEALLIDPRSADIPVFNAILNERRLRLKWVLRTHEHDLLIPGESEALDTLNAPRIQHQVPEYMGGQILLGNEHLQIIATPGHTENCLSFLWQDRFFCGDLLNVDACPYQPRPALPQALWDSVTRKVFTLPVETLLFSSHAYLARSVSNVLEQRRWHPWFANASRDDFLSRLMLPSTSL